MKVELSPLEDYYEPSMFMIGRFLCGANLYSYGVCKWANGLQGAIIDFNDVTDDVDEEGKSLIRPDDGRDFLQFVSSEIDLVRESEKIYGLTDLRNRCPLVASGIIARFVKINITDRNYPAMFKAYYDMEKKFYVIENQRRDPFSFSRKLEEEFTNGAHLQIERKHIEFSTKNLLPFLKESHREVVKRMADAYIAFVKQSMPVTDDGITWEEEKLCFKKAVLHVMELKKENGDYLFEKNTQWKAFYRFAVDSGIMYAPGDMKEPEDSGTAQYKVFDDFAHELQLDVNPPTRLPFKRSYIEEMNKDNYARYRKPHPWSKEGMTNNIKSYLLFEKLDEVYKEIRDEFYRLSRKA